MAQNPGPQISPNQCTKFQEAKQRQPRPPPTITRPGPCLYGKPGRLPLRQSREGRPPGPLRATFTVVLGARGRQGLPLREPRRPLGPLGPRPQAVGPPGRSPRALLAGRAVHEASGPAGAAGRSPQPLLGPGRPKRQARLAPLPVGSGRGAAERLRRSFFFKKKKKKIATKAYRCLPATRVRLKGLGPNPIL